MTCASCAKLSESALLEVVGVQSAHVNIAMNKAEVHFDETKTSVEAIIKAVENAGYGAMVHDHAMNGEDHMHHMDDVKTAKRRFIGSAIFTLPIFLMMFNLGLMTGKMFLGVDLADWGFAGLTAIVVLYFGTQFHKSAGKKLMRLDFNMDSLISMGTLTAFIYSLWAMFSGHFMYFEAAAAIITLINLGKWMEALSKGKASEAMTKLLELSVKNARVIRDGVEVAIPVDQVNVGDILHIKAGEKVALDGEIIEGSASIDESMLTGESLPREKKVGDAVFAATINQNSSIKVQVTKLSADTLLSQIVKMVEHAQMSKAPIQKLADKISGIFVPVVIVIAFITFALWYFFTQDLQTSILPAIAVLVIACPCALGLATPTAIMVGTSAGAKNGILIKNGETLEKSNNIDLVIFDKTGTLTEGKPQVTDLIPFKIAKDELLTLAGSLAMLSHHPLSQAITAYAKGKDVKFQEVLEFKEVSGKGVEGVLVIPAKAGIQDKQTIPYKNEVDGVEVDPRVKPEDDNTVRLGNQRFLESFFQIPEEVQTLLTALASAGKTPMLIAQGNAVIGIIAVMDTIKSDAKQAVSELQVQGIEVMMISGDARKTAEAIASQLGITKVIAEVLPQDKAVEVQKLQTLGKKVAFVGDGINDAPALAQADLGIAMGTGSDIAIETGNIVLMQGSPSKVVSALKLSQKTFHIIKQNLFWAFIYNIIGIPVATLGLLNPIFASFAMAFSSVSVILNSMKIQKNFSQD